MSKDKIEGVFAMSAKQAVELGKRLIIMGELSNNPGKALLFPISPTKIEQLQASYEAIVYELDYERMSDESGKHGNWANTNNNTKKVEHIGEDYE